MFAQWSDDYNVNIREIDSQHRRLFELVNELHDAMSQGQGSKLLGDILNNLLHYTKMHFSTEERYMSTYKYPGFMAHKAEHDELTKTVVDFVESYRNGKALISIQLMNFLINWLKNHILATDKKSGSFLISQDVK